MKLGHFWKEVDALGTSQRTLGCVLIGLILGPLVPMSVYLWMSRWPTRWFTASSDWTALLLSVSVGLIFVPWLPVSAAMRVIFALLYFPIACLGLFLYTMGFVGAVFGDCL